MDSLPDILKTRKEAPRLSKKERTRRQLIAAAIATFSKRGVADATMQQIAVTAGMTTGTVYNHFRTKKDVVTAVARTIAETIRERSASARAGLATGTEQMAAGCRRYLALADRSPSWALLILDVASVDEDFRKTISSFVLTELRLGMKRGEFSVTSEAVGLDLVIGATMEAMRRIALGRARKGHGVAVTEAILRGLGVPAKQARLAAAKPLPLFDK
jgi:AcrR family transcriptional regulator